ncbi:MAG: S1C family serine protease [Planctomycetaceae bacterium]|nr:S1C family serine protease [Planctomycetaceae bacterium]
MGLLVTPLAAPSVAADNATATPADAAKDSLNRLLAGATPMGVADLKAMQAHVRSLTDQLMKCTVGVEVGRAQGSGVIISKDGYVLTAAHVAGRPNKDVIFYLADGTKREGKTLGLNRTLDAGLMKITDAADLPFAEMGLSKNVNEGQWCLAMGHPGGYQSDRKPVLRLGRVLAITGSESITTDCTLVGGDSGGPLFDMQGKVIGINSRIATGLTANMHVPVGTFQETWERLKKAEEWGHYPGQTPWLGVVGEEGTTEARLAKVNPDSPAEKGGLKPGDIITKFDGVTITDFASLSAEVQKCQPGAKMGVEVKRGDETIALTIRIGRKD